MTADAPKSADLVRVGALARRVGKSVRALHLYEEMGLLHPACRSNGGFRLYDKHSEARIRWILKLQAIGFSLPEIREFAAKFENSDSGRDATQQVRETFEAKLADVRDQLRQMKSVEEDIVDALAYLESCNTCTPTYTPDECHQCSHHGHEIGSAPELFAGLSETATGNSDFDVDVAKIRTKSAPEQSEQSEQSEP